MSLINPNNIDGQYPIAGQDNDSQGFRDNFTNIKNNFTIAYNELADLQGKVVLKSALSGGSIDNNMSYSILEAAQLKKAVETKRNIGTISGSDNTISWADGHFQFFTTGGDVTVGFSGWPTNNTYAKLRLQITTDTTNRAVTFPAAVSVGLADIQGAVGQTITFPTAGVYLFELTTVDNGTTITIQDLLRNYDIVTTGLTGAFSGNVIGGLARFAAINSTPIGNATPSTGAFTTLSASGLTTLTGGISGNVVINDPIGAGSFGSNLTVKGTVEFKSQDQSNNASVNTSTKSLTLAPGGDQFVLININGNCSIGYNATITPGHQTTVHVKNSAGALAYVIVPNENTNTGNAFIGLATGITGTFVFTSYGTDAGNVFVTVSR